MGTTLTIINGGTGTVEVPDEIMKNEFNIQATVAGLNNGAPMTIVLANLTLLDWSGDRHSEDHDHLYRASIQGDNHDAVYYYNRLFGHVWFTSSYPNEDGGTYSGIKWVALELQGKLEGPGVTDLRLDIQAANCPPMPPGDLSEG